MTMTRMRWLGAVAVAFSSVALINCSSGATDERSSSTSGDDLGAIPQFPTKALCTRPADAHQARCHARVRTDSAGTPLATPAATSGLSPADLRSAYKLPATGGNGKIVAIVDANDDPNAESDLATYRSNFGLPPCTTANGCFKKVNQSGQTTNLPSADSGWAGEISLDLDMVSAACPDCKILLVEANSADMADLGAAVNTAVKLGAVAVSNSYGGGEDSSITQADEQYFHHPGVTITASSGDNGYGTSYPASSQYVTAVGGTSLVKSTTTARGWKETAWTSAGSGCSAYIAKPSWQKDTGCPKRTVADVATVADPNTGVAVYDTYQAGGWQVYGGTSASAPFVAAAYVVLGLAGVDGSYSYSHLTGFYDVTSGSNGSCGGTYLCTSGSGYDGPTGNGTPNGSVLTGGGGGGGTPDAGGGGTPDAGGGGTPDAGGGGGSTCTHPICTSGGKLTSTCDACATKICKQDSYCCTTAWDSTCVSEVGSICGETCGGGGGGGGGGGSACSHSICTSGGALTSSCDACATKVCASDSYCCNTAWDNICVGEVSSICGQTCK